MNYKKNMKIDAHKDGKGNVILTESSFEHLLMKLGT